MYDFRRSLGLGDEEHMAHTAFLEGDGPVGRIIAHRRGNLERARQLGVDRCLGGGVHVLGKLALTIGIGEHEALDVLFRLVRLARVVRHALGEDRSVVATIYLVVADVLDDHRSLLGNDKLRRLFNELLGGYLKETEYVGIDSRQNHRSAPARDSGSPSHARMPAGWRPWHCRYQHISAVWVCLEDLTVYRKTYPNLSLNEYFHRYKTSLNDRVPLTEIP